MLKNKYKYIILGGGLSGLSTAYVLSRKYKEEVLVIEKNDTLGGLSRTIVTNLGDRLDIGSHRLQESYLTNIIRFISRELNIKLNNIIRLSKLYINNGFISYPINSFELFKKISILKSVGSLAQSFYYKVKFKQKDTFEKTAKSRVGDYIYEYFYQSYAKKVWGTPLGELSNSIMKKRFRLNPFTLAWQVLSKSKRYFLYPKGGFGKIVDNIESILIENKVEFILGEDKYNIIPDKNIIEINGSSIIYENLITTIPIDIFSHYINYENKNILSYRGLYIAYLYINQSPLIQGETFYFPEEEFIFGRVSIPKRFDKSSQSEDNYTIYTVEIPAWKDEYDYNYMIEESLIGLQKSGLINNNYSIDYDNTFFHYEPNVYPMYKIGRETNLDDVLSGIHNKYKNIYISGRQGLFLHCNVDHTMDLGFELGNNLLENDNNLNWQKVLNKYNNCVVRD
ncbi:NAD(P)-binding protein [Candidatus Gracilibacteria bacterium]|nr:NAD(P)-binding protein [Candidatus Gracilibacteria bacterium]